MDQSNLLDNMEEFSNKSRPRPKEGKIKKKTNTFDSLIVFMKVEN